MTNSFAVQVTDIPLTPRDRKFFYRPGSFLLAWWDDLTISTLQVENLKFQQTL